jgi:hypothetical protein
MDTEEWAKCPLAEVALKNINYPPNTVFQVPLSGMGIDCFVTDHEV